jgi:threonine synthase
VTTEYRSSRGAEGSAQRSPGNRRRHIETSIELAVDDHGANSDPRCGKDEENLAMTTAVRASTDATTTSLDLGPAQALSCRECGHQIPLAAEFACAECFGPLEIAYSFGTIRREDIEAGPNSIWRYRDLLPVPSDVDAYPNTEPGLTRLIRADRLAAELGVRRLWVKDDTGNPTHSFKDRVVAVALAAARQLGFRVLACPSTGNLANAVAAAAARAGWESVVLIPSSLERAKVLTTAVYDGALIAVDGNYDDVNRLATELAAEHEDWAFVNVNVRPYYAEGSKTLAFEVAEQLGWRLPDQIVVPIASGAQLTKVDKGFTEFGSLGLVEQKPYRVFGAQAAGCSPVSAAYKAGQDVVAPVRPDTIARSLAIGAPADGPYVLDVVRRTGGAIEDVTDEEIVEGIRLLARTEGIFTETAGGVTVATARKLIATGQLDPDAETVLLITGDGLKTLDAVQDHVGPRATVAPSTAAVRAALAD